MKTLGKRSVASLIRVVLEAAWWLVVAGLAALSGLLLFSICAGLESKKLTMDLPIAFELQSLAQDGRGAVPADAQIEKLRGNLRFPVQGGLFFSVNMALILLLLVFVLCVLTQLRHVFLALSRGRVFVPENVRRIRWVGLAVVFGEFAHALVVYGWSYYTSLHFTANGLRFTAATDFSFITVFSGMAIVVIAEVFREGTRLQEEQSLTI